MFSVKSEELVHSKPVKFIVELDRLIILEEMEM